jgi:UDP-glucose 4-epimerase
VYGPRQTPDGEAGVVAIFAGRMLSGQTPVVFGDGEQARDFVYVGDVAEVNLLAVERRLQGAYNVGVGEAASVNRVTAELARACGYDGPAEHVAERDGEVRSIMLDAGKLTRETGWRPTVSLTEGIGLTVADHKARLSRVR